MLITVHLNASIEKNSTSFDTFETLILSTQNRRYKTMLNARVYNVSSVDIFHTALADFHAGVIVLDLFDDYTKRFPKVLGAFLDDFEEGAYGATQLVLVVENRALIEEWELFDVTYI